VGFAHLLDCNWHPHVHVLKEDPLYKDFEGL